MFIVLIHGIMSDKGYFNEMNLCLNKEYKIISMDRKSYGENVAVENLDFSVKRQAEEALRFLKENTTSPVYIIGHSASGFIALEMLIQDSSLIKAILLFESSIGLYEEDKERLLDWNRELDKYIESNRILKAIPSFTKLIGNNEKKEKAMIPI